jgi:CheY-like chemotaxis protein
MVNRVLVVDDDEADLDTMKTVLEENGYEVVAVSDGAKAIEEVSSGEFKLVLADINMPTFSGYDLARLLRDRVKYKVGVIYVSIVPEQEVDMEGVDGFVQKPFSPNNLMGKINEIL